jgi:hypothetical protein
MLTARIWQHLSVAVGLTAEHGESCLYCSGGSGNKLTSVEGLTKCVRLKELSLCNNELTSVRGIPKLAELDVSHPSPPSCVPPQKHLTTPLHSPHPSRNPPGHGTNSST